MSGRKKKFGQRSSSKRVAERDSPFVLALDENHSATVDLHRQCNISGICYKTMQECGLARGTGDEDVMRVVAERGYILLSTDKNIRRNELELAWAMRYRSRQFVFSNGNMNGKEMASALKRALPRLRSLAKMRQGPFVMSIGKHGDILEVVDEKGRCGSQARARSTSFS